MPRSRKEDEWFRKRLRLRWTVDQDRIDDDEKSDGMYPLLTNDRSLTAEQLLEAHKRQPNIEKRFQQTKTVHEIAPLFLNNEGVSRLSRPRNLGLTSHAQWDSPAASVASCHSERSEAESRNLQRRRGD